MLQLIGSLRPSTEGVPSPCAAARTRAGQAASLPTADAISGKFQHEYLPQHEDRRARDEPLQQQQAAMDTSGQLASAPGP